MEKTALIVFLSAVLLAGCMFTDTSPNRCDNILDKSFKDDCYFRVAKETNNVSKCYNITDTTVRGRCFYLMSQSTQPNASTCSNLAGMLGDQCFLNAAQAANDFTLCADIIGNTTRENCYESMAYKGGNASLCNEVASVNMREDCLNSVFSALAVKQRNPEFCKSIKSSLENSTQALINNCYMNMVKQLNDTSYCANIDEVYMKEFCITGKIDPSLCTQITDPNGRDMCEYTVAVQSKDPTACANVAIDYRDSCYLQVAHELGDTTICDQISSSVLKDACGKQA